MNWWKSLTVLFFIITILMNGVGRLIETVRNATVKTTVKNYCFMFVQTDGIQNFILSPTVYFNTMNKKDMHGKHFKQKITSLCKCLSSKWLHWWKLYSQLLHICDSSYDRKHAPLEKEWSWCWMWGDENSACGVFSRRLMPFFFMTTLKSLLSVHLSYRHLCLPDTNKSDWLYRTSM